jgi:hypothetical protein
MKSKRRERRRRRRRRIRGRQKSLASGAKCDHRLAEILESQCCSTLHDNKK